MGVRSGMKITRMLAHLNGVVHAAGLSSSFVSAFYGELGEDGTVLYANAGHPPPILRGAGGIVELEGGNMVLGPSPDVRFRRRFCHLRPGDVLLAYSDGIIERQRDDGRMYGVEGLEAVLDEMQGVGAGAILDRVFETAHAFGEGAAWEDDATAVVIRREPARR
jgi:sigma-B regulation protein RsbU (phosphoserine phosphatase)